MANKALYEITSIKDGEQNTDYIIAKDAEEAMKKVSGNIIRVNFVSNNVKE